jgi:hypothetical protein
VSSGFFIVNSKGGHDLHRDLGVRLATHGDIVVGQLPLQDRGNGEVERFSCRRSGMNERPVDVPENQAMKLQVGLG